MTTEMDIDYSQLVKLVKEGKKIDLDLSFLDNSQNELLTTYLNKKLKKRFYKEQIVKTRKDLRLTLRKLKKDKDNQDLEEKVKDFETKLDLLKGKIQKYKFARFDSIERQRIHRITNKIRSKISEFEEKGEEFKTVKQILEFLNFKL